jgi:molecular chaperone GrpE (heat shock protein)
MTSATRRSYSRRSDDERIAELQSKIEELKQKMETRQRPDMVVLREIPKIQKKLRRFAQVAADNGRDDIANSTVAFIAGLDRMIQNVEMQKRRSRGDDDELP